MPYRIIYLHTQAPIKPPVAAPCNGCGVCCATEPCPVGALVSGRLSGACRALQWAPEQNRYLCGLVSDPAAVLPKLPTVLVPLVHKLAKRWIASGSGCDCNLEISS